MKVMIVCKSAKTTRSGFEETLSIIHHCIRAETDPTDWSVRIYHADDGASVVLIAGSSAVTAAALVGTLRRRDATLDIDLWQDLDGRDFGTALFP